jgi:LacI family transcriptional regulator
VRECIEYLYENGHRDIAYIGEPLTEGKEDFIISEMEAHGLEIRKEWFISSRSRFEDAGKDGVKQIMSLDGKKPSAMIGSYGYITQGIISALEEMGLSVPEDMSVISMDNDPFPIHHSLDVAHIPSATDELCAEAMKLLHCRIKNDRVNIAQSVNVDSCFIKGNTVKKIN